MGESEPPSGRQSIGLIASCLGGLLGALAGGVAGERVGEWTIGPDGGGLEDILNIFLGIVIGIWGGSTLGVWLALRADDRPAAGATASLFAFFVVPTAIIFGCIVVWFEPFGSQASAVAGIASCVILSAVSARWVVAGRGRAEGPFDAPPSIDTTQS